VFFRPLSRDRANPKSWEYKLREGENAESVSVGSGWAAAFTDSGLIRIFTAEGVQKQIISIGSALVTTCAYENLLAFVYHQGVPVYGS